MQKEREKEGKVEVEVDLEKTEEIENEVTEDSVRFQIAISVEWVEGLMQRIQQSLVSSTPLIMCEKDLDALDFMVLATSISEPKAILDAIGQIKEEAEKAQSKGK